MSRMPMRPGDTEVLNDFAKYLDDKEWRICSFSQNIMAFWPSADNVDIVKMFIKKRNKGEL